MDFYTDFEKIPDEAGAIEYEAPEFLSPESGAMLADMFKEIENLHSSGKEVIGCYFKIGGDPINDFENFPKMMIGIIFEDKDPSMQ